MDFNFPYAEFSLMKFPWPTYPLWFHVHARTQYTWYVSLFPLSSMCTWTLYFIPNSLSFLVQIYFIWSCIDQTIRSPGNAHVCMYFLLLSLSLLACIFTTSVAWSHVRTPSKLRQATRYIWSPAGFLYFLHARVNQLTIPTALILTSRDLGCHASQNILNNISFDIIGRSLPFQGKLTKF